MHLDHFVVLEEGKREELAPAAPVAEGAKVQLTLGEVGLHDPSAGVGKVEGFDVCVAGAAKQVGKKVNVQIERVLDGMAYGTLVTRTADAEEPITAEGEAEKPTRRAPAKKAEAEEPELEAEEEIDTEAAAGDQQAAAKKKTRRGSRGGRGRKKATAPANGTPPVEAKIHVPAPDLGEPASADESPAEPSADTDGTEPPKAKRKTRRGTRGGRNRKKKTGAAAAAVTTAEPEPGGEATASGWEYVPMSEWGEDVRDEG